MNRIILASTSPRRSELMKQAGYEFDIISPECDENIDITIPSEYVMELSLRKCLAGAENIKDDAFVIGADTVVVKNEQILGKPVNESDAFNMLKLLSGDTHSVYTGVTVYNTKTKNKVTFFEKTDVTFYDVSDSEIIEYINSKEPMDKAGAYGIQGLGVFLVKSIHGDYNNVVGLPVAHLIRVINEMSM